MSTKGLAKGAITGAGLGTELGTIIPGIGNAIGAAIGAAVGSVLGVLGIGQAKKKIKQLQVTADTLMAQEAAQSKTLRMIGFVLLGVILVVGFLYLKRRRK